MNAVKCLAVAALAAGWPQKGLPDMPMLKWAGKDKVVNHHNDVPFRVLERKWGWRDEAHTEARSRGR